MNTGKRRITSESANLEAQGYAKIPPQALDLEEAVLGALMLGKEGLTDVAEFLHAEIFYKEAHQKIYAAIKSLFISSDPVDILTVVAQLRASGELESVGGAYYIAQLTNRVASAANTEFHARILLQKYIQREMIRISSETMHNAYLETTDAFKLLETHEEMLFKVQQQSIRKAERSALDVYSDVYKKLSIEPNENDITGIGSGFIDIDRITGGWQESDLIILAARPSMGKTALALEFAMNPAKHGKATAFFSLEMSDIRLAERKLSTDSGVNSRKIMRNKLGEYERADVLRELGNLSKLPVYFDDTPAISIFELRAKCRRLKAKRNIEMVVVDYLQLMTAGVDAKTSNREGEISYISRGLKGIAKELKVPVIALCQLSRETEKQTGEKRPKLHHLRESGAIEQDADIVMFLYRPEKYDIETFENGESTAGVCEVEFAKNRNGDTDTIRLRFNKETVAFKDYMAESHVQTHSNYALRDFTERRDSESLPY